MTDTLEHLFKNSFVTYVNDTTAIFSADIVDGGYFELIITRTFSDSDVKDRCEYLKIYNTYIGSDTLDRNSEDIKEAIANILEVTYPNETKAGFTETIAPDLSIQWDQLHVSHFGKYSTTVIHGIGA